VSIRHRRSAESLAPDEGCIGKGLTREDHPHWGAQLYAAYAHMQDVRALASVIGEEEWETLIKNTCNLGVPSSVSFQSIAYGESHH